MKHVRNDEYPAGMPLNSTEAVFFTRGMTLRRINTEMNSEAPASDQYQLCSAHQQSVNGEVETARTSSHKPYLVLDEQR